MSLSVSLAICAFLLFLLIPISISVRIFGGFSVTVRFLFIRFSPSFHRKKKNRASDLPARSYLYPAISALKCLTAGCKITLRSDNGALLSDSPHGEVVTKSARQTALLTMLAFLSPFADDVDTEESPETNAGKTSLCFRTTIARAIASAFVFLFRFAFERLQTLYASMVSAREIRRRRRTVSAYVAK